MIFSTRTYLLWFLVPDNDWRRLRYLQCWWLDWWGTVAAVDWGQRTKVEEGKTLAITERGQIRYNTYEGKKKRYESMARISYRQPFFNQSNWYYHKHCAHNSHRNSCYDNIEHTYEHMYEWTCVRTCSIVAESSSLRAVSIDCFLAAARSSFRSLDALPVTQKVYTLVSNMQINKKVMSMI